MNIDWSRLSVDVNDGRIESEGGMKKADAASLLAFCQGIYCGKDLMLIVRGSKPASLPYHYRPCYFPKPLTEKTKIPYSTGVIERGDGNLISDYDLQGVYEQRDGAYYRLYISNGAHSAPADPLQHRFLGCLNRYLRPGVTNPREALFQHGPNDDYLDCGRPQNPGIGDVFLAFISDGTCFLIPDKPTLKEFYHRQRISWNY